MILLIDGESLCKKCGISKPLSEFYKDKAAKNGVGYYCKVCAKANARRLHKVRKESNDPQYARMKRGHYYKTTYGITLEEFENMWEDQGRVCAICRVGISSSGTGTHLDHCHTTGKIRGLLCTQCNIGLGGFKDNKISLMQAIAYLNEYTND